MLATLIRKEWLANLLTMRLAVALAFTVLLTVRPGMPSSIRWKRCWAQVWRATRTSFVRR
ncbi:MAG TPA: hypothetical protein QF604_18765 [Candidatus Latescibacteria bacterium]|jgi:hypothetical protein|nr:hypothetical protein [Gemmatimonadota bacterium]MDP7364751.1 hypothetical protein [Candidatus Latescibacterota bacterium]MDP7634380.1 hypothetical protein [Candidatus Latescibacterota bacterium]HJN29951.1 hypothetical protein [Candidatus Latescibacterota bacterium]|tara:strand:- start:105 stop:284 length:180 start_codon:yes stop_codon:yes gene_type:complete